ncbi:MAG: 3-oxoacyl-ACP synthase [Cyclobacteriaceae bacterium]|nr:3-oxoacyl-ACP synthase [Cyclobacteriaceae bacterium]
MSKLPQSSVREKLYNLCIDYVRQRMDEAEDAIRVIQRSANEETKSSAGDKYETGRAMAQIEIEKSMVQLAEAKKLNQVLIQIKPGAYETVQLGSVAITTQGNFYLTISAGKLSVDNETFFAISPASPIGMKLSGKAKGESFNFNGKEFVVKEVL